MSGFDGAFARLIGNEGGLSMDRNDSGNWTGSQIGAGTLKGSKYGISAASYPDIDIQNLTMDAAKAIYLQDYWLACACDKLADPIAFLLFDMAVNSGQGNAIRALQKALGVVADGVLGDKSMAAIAAADPGYLYRSFNGARLQFLTGMNDQKWGSQGRGLVNRVAKNLMTP